MKLKALFLLTAAMIVTVAVIGCDSDDDGGGGGGSTTLSGVLIDSPVEGINYATATHSGITNTAGSFSYEPGETIVFSIGDTALPAATARGIMTPPTVFDTNDFADTRVVNLSRLLQTLDTDSNPANGITIAAAAHTVLTGITAIDFSSATFDTDASVVAVVAGGGGASTLVSGTAAIAELKSNSIVGTWIADNFPTDGAVLHFFADNTYAFGDHGTPDSAGTPGTEFGTWTWNQSTGAFSASTSIDTNGEWGLSHPQSAVTVSISGDALTYTDTSGSFNLTRFTGGTSAIEGTWYVKDSPKAGVVGTITFLSSGYYVHTEIGNATATSSDGVELGTWTSWNASAGTMTISVINDTNGDIGLSGSAPSVTDLYVTADNNGISDTPTGTKFLYRLIP